MNIFNKNTQTVFVIKFFNIVNIQQARKFNADVFLNETLLFLKNEFAINFNNYSLNFGNKIWKTTDGLSKGLKKDSNNIIDISCSQKDSYNIFTYSNFILNIQKNIPEFGIIESMMSINSEKIDISKVITYLKKHDLFDYGYIDKLSTNFDFSSETKITKRLFSQSTIPDKFNDIWNNHKYSILKGFLRKIYPINFLNSSQLEQKIIKQLRHNKIGQFEHINSKITMWILNKNEIGVAINAFKDSKYLLATKDAEILFENTQEALEYKKMTDIGLIWNSDTCTYE